ncbi:hypothetical protein AVT69_gp367 [Pseudomonas phage PhiPA3]|uniref:Uncharacterized protein 369 n=1 Tax=Pseudomonas phage PhiPA3 TaxID=998086 RepID=F8SJK1_BPPA3|nr:hypothetical protein AVT69_gp367 [Pseudomonas phage PhiPA3]AEH03792.1 hypothetical protein [Pseudomonas phage PhiPA3]
MTTNRIFISQADRDANNEKLLANRGEPHVNEKYLDGLREVVADLAGNSTWNMAQLREIMEARLIDVWREWYATTYTREEIKPTIVYRETATMNQWVVVVNGKDIAGLEYPRPFSASRW